MIGLVNAICLQNKPMVHVTISKTGTRVLRDLIQNIPEIHILPEIHIRPLRNSIDEDVATPAWSHDCVQISPKSCFFTTPIITMIRDPIKRLLSEYMFTHKNPSLHAFYTWASGPYKLNWQLAVLSGIRWRSVPCRNYIV